MSFLNKMFSKADYFATIEKETERLKANKDSQALISLIQDIPKQTAPSNNKGIEVEIFAEKKQIAVYKVASAIAELGDPKAVEPVIEGLKYRLLDNDTYWWSPAPQIIAKFGSVAVEPLIVRLLNEKGDMMKNFVTSALGLIGDQRAIPPLLNRCEHHLLYKSFNPTTVWALANIGGGREVVAALVQALTNSRDNKKGQAEALFALASGKFGKLAEEMLLPLLNDKDIDRFTKREVARALCEVGNLAGLEILLGSKDFTDLMFLGHFSDPRIAEKATAYLDTHPHNEKDSEWVMAALGLAEQNDTKSVKLLLEALAVSKFEKLYVSPWYRHSVHDLALQAIRKLGKPAVEELSNLIKVSDTPTKNQAERILQSLQSS